MILSVGEILIDKLVKKDSTVSHVGGAPFNVAVNAYRHGAAVKFFGRVGNDESGLFVKTEAQKYLPDRCMIETDQEKATTIALVTLIDGERTFRFIRDDTADYAFEPKFDFDKFSGLKILHLGTLMLNKPQGRAFAEYIVAECEKRKILLSVDANFRDDLFCCKEERNRVMIPFLKAADIVKFSDDELFDVTGKDSIEEGIKAFDPKGLMFVTCGKKGSVAYGKKFGFVYCESKPAEKVVDTTGAGDAYFGTVLALLDKNSLNIDGEILKKSCMPAISQAWKQRKEKERYKWKISICCLREWQNTR